jgi:NAD(P)-dependent dehydrogenase (short-subunit alcohol dehydrogenase family)
MKTILVTGSSRGIGKEICISLSKKGHQVFACSRSKIQIPGCKSLIMDPGDLDSIKDTFRYLQDEKILFDGLVNNAGLLVNKPFLEISESDFQNLAQVNWIGPAMTIQKILPLLNHGAHVLNISSMGGISRFGKVSWSCWLFLFQGCACNLNRVSSVRIRYWWRSYFQCSMFRCCSNGNVKRSFS